MAPNAPGLRPYIINKDVGAPLQFDPDQWPATNADGLPIIEPTPEQKYAFDTNGWLLIPSVLSEDDLRAMREFCVLLHREPESLPEHARGPLGGPTQKLIDHPIVVGMLHEFAANPSLSSAQGYGFSLGSCQLWYRTSPSRRAEQEENKPFRPHNGNGLLRLPGDVLFYNAFPGKAFCPHIRVVWELNSVRKGRGGTMLVSASHKSVYTAPDEIQDPKSNLWTDYGCPAGSVLLFAEPLTHSGHPWTDEENDRIAIGCLYNPVDGGWPKREKPHPELLRSMPPLRRTLFRDRYTFDNVVGET